MAQMDRSAITGIVTDQQGNQIPQARVSATQSATGLQRETITSSQGTYQLSDLPAGIYKVRFLRNGFSEFTAERVRQIVGETRTLDVRLQLAQGQEQASVTEALIQVDKVDARIGAPIEQAQIDDLPINGRNWATLTSLAPGAIDNGSGDQRTIRFAGHGLDDNNLTLDGIDATAVYNQEQREYMRLNIPLDSITEFQVQSQNFGADVQGGTAGGQVAVISPIRYKLVSRGCFRLFPEQCIRCPLALRWKFFRPFSAEPVWQPDVWRYEALGRQVDNEDSGMIRIDQHFSDRTTAFTRFNSDEAVETIPTGQLTARTQYDTKYNNGVVELFHVFTPSLVNEAKFGTNQTIYHTASLSPVPFGVNVAGFSALTGSSTTDYPSKSSDLADDATWAKGKHTVKFGFEIRWILLNQGTCQSGTLSLHFARKLS